MSQWSRASRVAYAEGWAKATALSGVPVTPRAIAGGRAVLSLADSPAVVEVALRLGHLEGVWATIYQRRDRMEARHRAVIMSLLADLVHLLDWSWLQNWDFGPRESAESDRLYARLRSELLAQKGTAWWKSLSDAIYDAVRDGSAEGRASAIALVADRAGATIDFQLAFEDGYAALGDIASLWAESDTWVANFVDALAHDLGPQLEAGWRAGADYDTLRGLAMDSLGTDARAAGYVVDMSVGNALSAGSLATYDSAGIDQVDFMTASDEGVCDDCQAAEDGNPQALDEVEIPPLHPNCRCTLSPVITVPDDASDLWAEYETEGA